VEFRILGPLQVLDEGRELPVTGSRQRALLAILLLNANEVVSSDRLLDELWGDEPPGSGLTALQVRVSQLRKALGTGATMLETHAPGYLLRLEPDDLDLTRFLRLLEESDQTEPAIAAERLREALSLWRGPPLGEFAFESFARAPLGRLDELRLTALERRIEADLALGRSSELVGELEALVIEQPLRERLRGQLMLALYRSGRQAEALAAYQATRRMLIGELGIEPSPVLQELEKAILRHDPALVLARLPTPERSILVASRDEWRLEALLALAEPLARRPKKELILARPISDADDLSPVTSLLNERRESLLSRGVAVRAAAFTSAQPGEDLIRIAVEQDVDLLLIDGSTALLEDAVLATVLAGAPCDVAVLVGDRLGPGPVLVPFVGGEHDWAAVELGAWISGALGASLLLAGLRQSPAGRDASRLLASASLAVQRALGVAADPLLLDPGSEALVSAAGDVAIVVVGLTDRWQKEGLGPVREALTAKTRRPVVLVRHGLRPGGLAPSASLTRFTWTLRPG
jgi:DNA-binding SARP family transcriptional activator